MKPETVYFFSRCRNAISVSDVVVAMAVGTPLVATRLPVDMLPAVLLLATVGVRTYNQQIVDDYLMVYIRMEEAFKDAELTNLHYDHPSLTLVSMLSSQGPRAEYWLDAHPEAGYIFTAYEELVNAELESLFKAPHAKVPIATAQGQKAQRHSKAGKQGKKKGKAA